MGKTLWEILTQTPKPPAEVKFHNPLQAKVGCTVCFAHEPDIAGVNFVIEKISAYKTKVGRDFYPHTDYHLKGISLDKDRPIRSRLRLIPDDGVPNKLGHKVQLLYLYDEMEYDEVFHKNVLGKSTFEVNQDDEGNQLDEARIYWRFDEGIVDPYTAEITVLQDTDNSGVVEENELGRYNCTYWDYARNTEYEPGNEITEYLTVEMDDETGYFTFLRGTDVLPSQIMVF